MQHKSRRTRKKRWRRPSRCRRKSTPSRQSSAILQVQFHFSIQNTHIRIPGTLMIIISIKACIYVPAGEKLVAHPIPNLSSGIRNGYYPPIAYISRQWPLTINGVSCQPVQIRGNIAFMVQEPSRRPLKRNGVNPPRIGRKTKRVTQAPPMQLMKSFRSI